MSYSHKVIRNTTFLPNLEKEGTLLKKIPLAAQDKLSASVYERLFSHHTLASIRRLSFYVPKSIHHDSLDFLLDAKYNHSCEFFPDKLDVFLQPETLGKRDFLLMRNCRQIPMFINPDLGHPMRCGGIFEKRNPNNVKLMNSGLHSSQTNPGYSRQAAGGAIFFY